MTGEPNGAVDRTSENLNDALGTVTSELVRADAKANIALALSSVGLGFVVTRDHSDQALAVLIIGALGATCLMVASVVLLMTVRPVHIDDVSAEGWSRWAVMQPAALRAHMRIDLRAERVAFLARAVKAKFRKLRIAVNFILAGVVLLFVAGLLALLL
ncbi:Pycsar system effector family protein [Streptomyces sp. NPDC060194]|uniref:Pycsar system effector family protein n=1 Tax=Streptomyces sp. NPDC060194 TaxID=3347069 RepID=UPI0036675FAC